MEQRRIRAIGGLVVFVAFLWLLPSGGLAATITVDCNAGGTIGGTLSGLKPGDTLQVSGTCNEHLLIPEHVVNVTLDGQGKATIKGPDSARHNIQVRGRGIVIKKFTITGGRNGIDVQWGGAVIIDGNTIQNTGFIGIVASTGSFIGVVNNVIQNNPQSGILVRDSSSARIGSISFFEPSPSPNTIQNNGAIGIVVTRSSAATIGGNIIRSNKRNGVAVVGASHADIINNAIEGNAENGIHVAENSVVNLSNAGPGWLALPNKTDTAANNVGFGIKCSTGAYAAACLGTLTGAKGAKEFDNTCIDGLSP